MVYPQNKTRTAKLELSSFFFSIKNKKICKAITEEHEGLGLSQVIDALVEKALHGTQLPWESDSDES